MSTHFVINEAVGGRDCQLTQFLSVCLADNFYLMSTHHRNVTSIWPKLGCLSGGTKLGHPGNCDPLPISASLGMAVDD